MTTRNIRSFGATGDGTTKDTRAIQSALDTCARAGGGTVVVPPGVYLCGTLYLRDHTTLHLDPGATIRGSLDLADYNADDAYPQNGFCREENWTGAHLLIAFEARHVALTGMGTIDGNGSAFFGPPLPNRPGFSIKDRRPGQMVCFVECVRIRVGGGWYHVFTRGQNRESISCCDEDRVHWWRGLRVSPGRRFGTVTVIGDGIWRYGRDGGSAA